MSGSAAITVITHGRWHSFDLAEQLQKCGRLAAIFTGYSRFKLHDAKVAPQRIRSYPWYVVPGLALSRVPRFPESLRTELGWRGGEALTRYAARHLPECGVVTALSGSGREAGREIKRRGGVYVCDRGSTHIRWQERRLAEEYDKVGLPWRGIDPRPVANEEIEYELADAITVPSHFVRRSFVEMGVPESKLHVVPYGVDLSAFGPVDRRGGKFRVLFVGQLSVRKGVHYLLKAFRDAALPGAELVLVGPVTPDTKALLRGHPVQDVVLTGHLPRSEVAREMARASVLVLPSVEEGLALVMAQALACGCPVLASSNTGADDLFDHGREGLIHAAGDVEALTDHLVRLYENVGEREAMGAAGIERVSALGGWEAYGRRSVEVFDELLAERRAGG